MLPGDYSADTRDCQFARAAWSRLLHYLLTAQADLTPLPPFPKTEGGVQGDSPFRFRAYGEMENCR
jgi:hypothetical protein